MENEEIVEIIQRGENTRENMQALYNRNRRFIYGIAQKYALKADIEDLMQEAYFALENAVATYDPDRGKFTTHLAKHLKGRFFRFVGESCGVGVSARDFRLLVKYRRLRREELPEKELCDRLGVTADTLHTIQKLCTESECVSLDEPNPETDTCLLDTVPAAENLEESCIEKTVREQAAAELWEEVDALDAVQAGVIKSRFKEEKTPGQIAAELNTTPGAVKQLERKGLTELGKKRRLRELAIIYDCLNYRHTGFSAFKSRQMSNVEYVTMKKLELEERLKALEWG